MLANAHLHGSPCDGQVLTIDLIGRPPATLRCRNTTYYFVPNSRGRLDYGTADYVAAHDRAAEARANRDMGRAWHRLMHALEHTGRGEVARINGARARLKRAVR